MILNQDNIPKGYALSYDTWENDADNCRTDVLYGLSYCDVQFYVNLLSRFRPLHDGVRLCNEEIDYEREHAALEAAFAECPPDSDPLVSDVQTCLELRCADEFIDNLIDRWFEYSHRRVFDRFQVHYIPEECVNCTAEFEPVS